MRDIYPVKYYKDEGFVEYKLEINDEENKISNQSRSGDHFNAEEVRCRNPRKRCFLPHTGPSEMSSTTSYIRIASNPFSRRIRLTVYHAISCPRL